MTIRTEFVYNPETNITDIYIWKGMRIIDKKQLPDKLSWYMQKKIKKEIQQEYKDE